MTEIEKAFLLPTERKIVLKLGEIIWKKTGSRDDNFCSLTEPERTLIFVDILEGQVNNGGFHQFFFNSSGDYTYEILSAYERIKAHKTAGLVKNAVKLFPVWPVPKNTMARRNIMEDLAKKRAEDWDKLDDRFYEQEENIAELLIAYLKANIGMIRETIDRP